MRTVIAAIAPWIAARAVHTAQVSVVNLESDASTVDFGFCA